MKVLLCCIAKLENHYIEEWVRHYESINVDKIVLYDNNSTTEYPEKCSDVPYIKEKINSGLIDLYEVFDKYKPQLECYNKCYEQYKDEYDWLMFFDIDEFLILEHYSDIHDFLNQTIFSKYDLIHIPWKLFDDNDLMFVNDNDYSLMKRFTRPIEVKLPEKFKLNQEIKSIVRGHLNNIKFLSHPHTITSCELKCCNPIGIKDKGLNQKTKFIYHKGAWLNHYICKTLEEYLSIKQKRGGGVTGNNSNRYKTYFFFIYNERTQEKLNYIKEITGETLEMKKKTITYYNTFQTNPAKGVKPKTTGVKAQTLAGKNVSSQKLSNLLPKKGNTNIKVALCCILKMENNYLLEWVNHYKELGIDNIIMYDNNDIEGEYKEDIRDIPEIAKLIDEGYIIHHKIPGEVAVQVKYYNICYQQYSKDYDWIMFLDIDEFLQIDPILNCNTIQEYLSLNIYEKYNCIHLNWKLYDDNDLIHVIDNDYSIKERFTRELTKTYPNKNYLNKEIKSIIRTNIRNVKFAKSPHTMEGSDIHCCNSIGQTVKNDQKSQTIVHKYAWINHYICKTLEEFISIKLIRKGGHTKHEKGLRYSLNFFFSYNKRTSDKTDYIKSLIEKEIITPEIMSYANNNPSVKKTINEPVKKIQYGPNVIKKTIETKKISSIYKSVPF